jgi:hypothetical protein
VIRCGLRVQAGALQLMRKSVRRRHERRVIRYTPPALAILVVAAPLAIWAGLVLGRPALDQFRFRAETDVVREALAAAARGDSSTLAALSASAIPAWLYPVAAPSREVFRTATASGALHVRNGVARGHERIVTWAFPFVPTYPRDCGPPELQGTFVRVGDRWKLARLAMAPC